MDWTGLRPLQRAVSTCSRRALLLVFLLLLCAGMAAGQAAAEYAGATAKSGVTGTQVKPPAKLDSVALPAANPGSAHLPVRSGEEPEIINRRALEERAGKDAAKLMLRSVPTKARVQIDGKVVGATPLLLILAPGSYKVEMEGARMESGRQQVDLLPRETREVLLTLESPYPTRVRLRGGSNRITTP